MKQSHNVIAFTLSPHLGLKINCSNAYLKNYRYNLLRCISLTKLTMNATGKQMIAFWLHKKGEHWNLQSIDKESSP